VQYNLKALDAVARLARARQIVILAREEQQRGLDAARP
jgi:hypothetical protein